MTLAEHPFNRGAFALKSALFQRLFDAAEMRRFERSFCEEPAETITFETVMSQCPHFEQIFVDHSELTPFVNQYLPQIIPFCQSPFPLPGKHVVQGPWAEAWKIRQFSVGGIERASAAGKRVLDVGCNAGFDSFYLSTLGAAEVVGIEPAPFFFHALFLWTIYDCPNIRFVKTRWEDVTPATFGLFDIINCQGVLYHERNPMHLLETLFGLQAVGGKLVLETHVTMEDDMNARFVEGDFWGGSGWWWIPSVEVTAAMIRTAGYSQVQFHGRNPAPSKNPNDPIHTVEGIPAGGRALFTAVRER